MKRVTWVDAFKGILIIFVIIGHAAQGIKSNSNVENLFGYSSISFFKNMVYSFHMPAFFLSSGIFLYNLNQKMNKQYLKKKVFKLGYVYFVWSFITALFMQVASSNTNAGLGIIDFFYSPVKPFSQFWYLYVYLFYILTQILFILFFKNKSNCYLLYFGITLYLLNPWIPNIWILENYCSYLIYYSIGLFVLKYIQENTDNIITNINITILFIGLLIFSITYAFYYDKNSIVSYFIWPISSFFGILTFISISIKYKLFLKKIEIIGMKSLQYYVIHLLPLATIRILMLNYLSIKNLAIVFFVSSIGSILSCYILIEIIDRLKLSKILF